MATKLREIQTSFQSGQIDALAIARTDIDLFKRALKNGTNWRMTSTGAIQRRFGTLYKSDLGEAVRLLPFQFDDDENYIFAVAIGKIKIYDNDGVFKMTLTIPEITAPIIWEMSWVQSGDFMFLTHQDMLTREIQRTSVNTFTDNDYAFDTNDDLIRQMPFLKAADVSTTLTIAVAGPSFKLTTSANHWVAAHATTNVQVKYFDGTDWITYSIQSYTSATAVTATRLTAGAPAVTTATKAWVEEAINPIRGYPQAVAFHAGRLWFGGLKAYPAHIMGSRVGLFWNFDVGTGQDDEAILAPVDADKINLVRHLVSGQHLQVFTDFREMYVSEDEGVPITPSTLAIRSNTQYGCSYAKPQVFDDATLYMQKNGTVIREFLWNSVNRGYTSNPVSLIATDIVNDIQQAAIDYGGEDGPEQYCYFINGDGTLAVYHALRSEQINGFFKWDTEGLFKSVAVVNGKVWFYVKRTIDGVASYRLELLSSDATMDSAVIQIPGTPTSSFTVAGYHNETVVVTSGYNQYYLGEYDIDNAGALDISVNGYAVEWISIGKPFTATAETLPINFSLTNGPTEQMIKRLVSGFIRVDSSYDFQMIDDVFVPRTVQDDVSLPPTPYTGVRRAYFLGAAFDRTLSVVADIPLSCTLLSMGVEVGI